MGAAIIAGGDFASTRTNAIRQFGPLSYIDPSIISCLRYENISGRHVYF
jgi:hypothetical protein